MFYDAGLLLVVGIALADRFGESAREAIWACWAIAWLQLAAPNVGLAPLFLVVLASCGAVAWLALKQGSAPPVSDPAPA